MPGGDYFYRARPGAPDCLVAFGDVIDQRHLFAAEQLFDIDENQHTLASRASFSGTPRNFRLIMTLSIAVAQGIRLSA